MFSWYVYLLVPLYACKGSSLSALRKLRALYKSATLNRHCSTKHLLPTIKNKIHPSSSLEYERLIMTITQSAV
jgi:hypothetical protein